MASTPDYDRGWNDGFGCTIAGVLFLVIVYFIGSHLVDTALNSEKIRDQYRKPTEAYHRSLDKLATLRPQEPVYEKVLVLKSYIVNKPIGLGTIAYLQWKTEYVDIPVGRR